MKSIKICNNCNHEHTICRCAQPSYTNIFTEQSGRDGESLYALAKRLGQYTGSEEGFLPWVIEQAKGKPGDPGKDAVPNDIEAAVAFSLAPGVPAVSEIVEEDGVKTLRLGIPEGAKGTKGDQGPQGPAGKDTSSYTYKGEVPRYSDLPTSGNAEGDGWLVDFDGRLYIYRNGKFPPNGAGMLFRGPKGSSIYNLDLTNQNASVPATYEGNVIGVFPPSQAIVYLDGAVDNNWKFSALFVGCVGTINQDTGVISITAMNADAARVEVTAKKPGLSDLKTIFTLNKVRAGAPGEDPIVYWIIPSVNVVKVSKDGIVSPTSVEVEQFRRVGNNEPESTNDKDIRFRLDDGALQDYLAPVAVPNTVTRVTFYLYDGTSMLDIETVPVIRDGAAGDGYEVQWQVTERGAAPPNVNVNQGWTSVFPESITNTQTLWMRQRLIYGTGSTGPWMGPIKMTGDDGVPKAGPTALIRGDWSAVKQYMGNELAIDVVKYQDDGKGYMAKPTAGQIPVGTLPTNTQYWTVFEGNIDSIFTDILVAYNATIGNLTVTSLKTDVSGERMVIDPDDNRLKFYDTNNNLAIQVGLVEITDYQLTTRNVGGISSYSGQRGFKLSRDGMTINGEGALAYKTYLHSPFQTTIAGSLVVTSSADDYRQFGVATDSIFVETRLSVLDGNNSNGSPKISDGYTGTINGARFVKGVCVGPA